MFSYTLPFPSLFYTSFFLLSLLSLSFVFHSLTLPYSFLPFSFLLQVFFSSFSSLPFSFPSCSSLSPPPPLPPCPYTNLTYEASSDSCFSVSSLSVGYRKSESLSAELWVWVSVRAHDRRKAHHHSLHVPIHAPDLSCAFPDAERMARRESFFDIFIACSEHFIFKRMSEWFDSSVNSSKFSLACFGISWA